jgi:Fur family ferric uptake transcriptional regulator
MACEQIFLQRLRERGFRLTPQREMVLSAMHEMEGLATAEQIYGCVHAHSAAVDISTVYRTLDLLQELQMVACVDPGDGQYRYELLGVHGAHVHLICQSCGAVIGVKLEEVEPLAGRLRAAHGFAADLDHLTIPGLCQACAAARDQPA